MNKYLKCAAASVGFDLTIGVMTGIEKQDFVGFFPAFFASFLFSLPAIGLNVFDKYVHQNISDNKYFQYGATLLEIGLCLKAIEKTQDLVVITILVGLKALAIKSILDNDTSDTDFSYEVLSNNSELSVISDYS